MTKTINYNAVGRLNDLLATYSKINDLMKMFEYVKLRQKENLSTYQKIIKWSSTKNILLLSGIVELCGIFVSLILLLCGVDNIALYTILLFVLPGISFVFMKVRFVFKILPSKQKKYEEISKEIQIELDSIYQKALMQTENLNELTQGIDATCQNTLAIFIMQQALSEGLCQNIQGAQKFFFDRLTIIENNPTSENIKITEILKEKNSETERQRMFLNTIGDAVLT